MRKVQIKRILLSNWKGQTRDVCFPDGKTIAITGKNGSGKTSIYKAFCWLLTGYTDAWNIKNHELYDNRLPVTNETPSPTVKATIEVDGVEHVLMREAKPVFAKNEDGGYDRVSSDTYNFYIDDVPVTSTKFSKIISDMICDADLLPFILMGSKFANLAEEDKVKARKILQGIVGDIDLQQFKEKYAVIADKIGNFTMQQVKEACRKRCREIGKEHERIKTLIAYNEDELKKLPEIDEVALKAEIAKLDAEISTKRDFLNTIINDDEFDALSREYDEQRREYRNSISAQYYEVVQKIDGQEYANARANTKYESDRKNIENSKLDIKLTKQELEILSANREELLRERDSIMARVFSDDKCPYCGQELPEDMLNQQKEKFEATKRANLQAVVSKGKNVRAAMDRANARILELQAIIDKGVEPPVLVSMSELYAKRDKLAKEMEDFNNTPQGKALIEKMREAKIARDNGTDAKKEKAREEIEGVSAKKLEAQNILNTLERKGKIQSDIESMKSEIKVLVDKMSNEERQIACADSFTFDMCNIISKRVNDKLKGFHINMFAQSRDGEIKADCVIVSNDGVKYATMNNSQRIKATIAIQEMFAAYCDVSMPMFIDEASIFDKDNIPTSDGQTILLYAGETDLNVSNLKAKNHGD